MTATSKARAGGEARTKRLRLALLLLLALAWIGIVIGQVWCNTLERDEGYLNAAATLVSQGRLPYLDFLFPQQPFYPLLYGLLFKLTSPSLLTARIFSSFLYGCLVLLAGLYMLRVRRDREQALWAMLFLAFNTLALFWYTKAKHYIAADLFLFAAFFLVSEARAATPDKRALMGRLVLAGACATAAVQVRLLLAPALPLLALALLSTRPKPSHWKSAAGFSLGAFLAALPNLALFAQAPEPWLFNNFTLQLSTRPLVDSAFVLAAMGRALGEFVKLPENGLLLLLGLASPFLKSDSPQTQAGERPALLMVALLSLAFLAPTPTYQQYWVETLPYLVVAGTRPWVSLTRAFLARLPSKRLPALALILLMVGIGGYRAVGRMIYSQHWHPRWGLGHYLRFREYLGSHREGRENTEGRLVLTWWPGYLVADGLIPYPGSEFGRPCFRALDRLSEAEMEKRGMLHPAMARQAIAQQGPALVIMGPDSDPQDEAWLQKSYRVAAAFGDNRLYLPR